MNRALAYLKNSPWPLSITVLLFLTAVIWLKSLETCLVTKYSPQGTFSLQMAGERSEADSIRNLWRKTDCKDTENRPTGEKYISVAKRSYAIDTALFIPAYTALLFLLLLRWETDSTLAFKKKFIPYLPLVALLFDVLENLLSWRYLNFSMAWHGGMLAITIFKFLSVAICIAYMKTILATLSQYVKAIFNILWKFRIIVISMLFLYLALWQADQGQDLLINLNSTKFGVIIFYVAITITAALHWHLPKYLSANTNMPNPATTSLWQWIRMIFSGCLSYTNQGAPGTVKYVEDSDLARAFGVMTFLLPAFGILNVLDKYHLYQINAHGVLAINIVILAIALRYNWIDNAYKNSKGARIVFHVLILLAIPALIAFCLANHGRPKDMVWLFGGMYVLGFIFLLATSIRRDVSFAFLRNMKVSGWVMWPALGLALFFLIINFFPLSLAIADNTSIRYSTLSVFLCALAFYVLFFSLLVFWARSTQIKIGTSTRNINVAGIFLLTAFLFAKMVDNKFHDVDLKPGHPQTLTRLDDHIAGWLEDREKQITDTTRTYPVFIVSTYGGGIRAAAWTSLMIARLDQLVREKKSGDNFQKHVIAYSGASGGTIGASIMCALHTQDAVVSIDSVVNFYKKDFLSPVVTGLIGRDFFASTFGVNLADRSRLQDSIWEHHMHEHFHDQVYGAPFLQTWHDPYKTPLLFANTTWVEKGTKGVAVPVKIDRTDFPFATPVMQIIDNGEMKLSTAAFLSARFPFISPAGRINGDHHFLDGGIYENSGAETAQEIARVFKRVLAKKASWGSRFKLIIVSLKNSPPYVPEASNKNLFELSAPLKALLANIDGNAVHADSTNAVLFKKAYFRFYPKYVDLKSKDENDDHDVHNAILPLGWQLSNEALARLHANIVSTNPRDSIFMTTKALLKEF